jgi:hypothetical protein
MITEMLTPAEIEHLRRSAQEATAIIEAEFRRLDSRSIVKAIAEAEEAAGKAQFAVSDNLEAIRIWFAMLDRTADLRELTRLREPAIDEDCCIAGCGS